MNANTTTTSYRIRTIVAGQAAIEIEGREVEYITRENDAWMTDDGNAYSTRVEAAEALVDGYRVSRETVEAEILAEDSITYGFRDDDDDDDGSYDLAPATDLAPAMVVNTTRGARSVWERLAREASLDTLERVNASAHWSVTDLGHLVVEEELDRRAVATWTERAATMSDDGLTRLATAEHTWELVRTIVRREIDRRATRSDREHEDDRAYLSATGHGTLVESMNALDRAMAPTHHYATLVESMNALDRAMAPIVRTGRDIHTARISPALAHQTLVSVTGGNAARWER